jgi:hypothetical protein
MADRFVAVWRRVRDFVRRHRCISNRRSTSGLMSQTNIVVILALEAALYTEGLLFLDVGAAYAISSLNGTYMSLHAYRVEFLETASEIPNWLWDVCFQPPAEGRWWYETLDQSGIEDQFTFFYELIEHLRRPVGIAPGITWN